MTSPASTLRDLAARAEWPGDRADGWEITVSRKARSHLHALAPDLAVLCADMADALERMQYAVDPDYSFTPDPHIQALFARFAALVAPEERTT